MRPFVLLGLRMCSVVLIFVTSLCYFDMFVNMACTDLTKGKGEIAEVWDSP